MVTVLENIRQGLNRPSHRPERVRGLYKPVCCWGDNICTIRSPRPSGERIRVRGKAPISANLRVEPSEECDASVPR
ncbi:hypothetical protein AOY76_13190 [Escherichia coli]|nr:hypothetical protein AOY76_13190 [Escherichia coli]